MDTRSCAELSDIARTLRREALRLIYEGGDGHPGPTLSVADIVTALYFRVMRVDPARPDWPDRDRFILSKGHACPVLYAALARRGYFRGCPPQRLRALGSMLQGHPDMKKTPGVDMTSGSLGNGISIGLGMALAARYDGRDYGTYVVTGDGELEEGIVWEAAIAAAHQRMGTLTVIVDHNGLQSAATVQATSSLEPIAAKWHAFGWHCQEIDGHDMDQIVAALEAARGVANRPSLIVARTTKGKGVPFMENDNAWHKGVPSPEQFAQAMVALGGAA